MKQIIQEISEMEKGNAAEILTAAVKNARHVVFSTSFGKEDQVITHLIAGQQLPITFFTLDTGRLFEETYATFDRTIKKYGIKIKTYYPNQEAVQHLVSEKGPYSFYDSIENRKECCNIRKIEPLKTALTGAEIWITGLRAQQSEFRSQLSPVEWDSTNNIIKIHPLFDWSNKMLKDFIQKNNVPVNPLHAKGYTSIGCNSCTRAIASGEDDRAGRWWWESTKKECGLHESN